MNVGDCPPSREERLLIARVNDLADAAETGGRAQCSPFLTPRENELISAVLKRRGDAFAAVGGYPQAERRVLMLLPHEISPEKAESLCDCCWLEISVSRYEADETALTHRDFLGALLGLGLRRDAMGDIVTAEGSRAFVFARRACAEIVLRQLDQVGRFSVRCRLSSPQELPSPETRFDEIRDTVASLRLDAVLAAAFSLSRGSAVEAIRRQAVQLDGRLCDKPDAPVAPGCSFSLRGKGKALLDRVEGPSKKGRLFVIIRKLK